MRRVHFTVVLFGLARFIASAGRAGLLRVAPFIANTQIVPKSG
jgi:hypothetical protein